MQAGFDISILCFVYLLGFGVAILLRVLLPSMKALSWNCRGICNAATVRALKAQIKGVHLEIVFLSETKADEARVDKVMKTLGHAEKLAVNARGKAGGLCMM